MTDMSSESCGSVVFWKFLENSNFMHYDYYLWLKEKGKEYYECFCCNHHGGDVAV